MLFLDDDGRILWDGSDGMRSWAGRPASEWPEEWSGGLVLQGVDPLVMLGIRPPLESRPRHGHTGQAADALEGPPC